MKGILRALLVIMLACTCFSCAASGGHEKFRGQENTPFTNFDRHNIDPNTIMTMSQADFNEYVRKLNAMQDLKDRFNRTNAGSAAAEAAWVSPVNGRSNSFIGEVLTIFDNTAKGVANDWGNITRERIREAMRE